MEQIDENEVILDDITTDDYNNLIEESKNLLSHLYSNGNCRRIVNQDDLRGDVSSFVTSHLENIRNQNILKGLIESDMAKKILMHEVSTQEELQWYNSISSENSKNIDSLFRLFQPTQASPNPIITPAIKEEETSDLEMNSKERQAIEKLAKLFEDKMNKSNKE